MKCELATITRLSVALLTRRRTLQSPPPCILVATVVCWYVNDPSNVDARLSLPRMLKV